MEWQELIANTIARAGNAAVDVYVYRETGAIPAGGAIIPNTQVNTTPILPAQAQVSALAGQAQQYLPWVLGAVGVFLLIRAFKR